MGEVQGSKVTSVVIDPRSKFFGQKGELRYNNDDTGEGFYSFDNPEQSIRFNDGHLTGVPQVIKFDADTQAEADKLVAKLPTIRVSLEELYSEVIDPEQPTPTPETIAIKLGIYALIDQVSVSQV